MKNLIDGGKSSAMKTISLTCIFFCILFFRLTVEGQNKTSADTSLFYDSHFHLTNYIQEGIDIHAFLKVMGTKVGRSTLFGIPLQQQWEYGNSRRLCAFLLPGQ